MCVPRPGEPRWAHAPGKQRHRDKGPRLRPRGTEDLSGLCPVSPSCDLLLGPFLTLQSHLSTLPTHASVLCSEHAQLIFPAGCLCPAALRLHPCSLHLVHPCSLASSPCLSNSARSAFGCHIKRCLVCKGLLNHSNCAVPSLPSFLCSLFLCTDVRY